MERNEQQLFYSEERKGTSCPKRSKGARGCVGKVNPRKAVLFTKENLLFQRPAACAASWRDAASSENVFGFQLGSYGSYTSWRSRSY